MFTLKNTYRVQKSQKQAEEGAWFGVSDPWLWGRVDQLESAGPQEKEACTQRPRKACCTQAGIAGGDQLPSGEIPDWLVRSDHGSTAWVNPIAEVLRPSAGVGLCARAPAEGPGWAHLSVLVNGEERGPGDKLWIG
ncbi:hypothetical protein NDU88_002718 [Pleurodeles waltl]|uniref:Uncharacterized protein n=1 Tax=Pleurodeles waltl TaxID=8319 RepID=A0AAV7SED7_PLEWA|nr:hypothetical protein NDU88_002718 [Pleurodeles waltl]